MHIKTRIYYSEGDGGGEGSVGFDPASSPAPQRVTAKYETQLPKEYQSDDFSGIEDLGKLYQGYKALKAESSGKAKLPSKESTQEEISGFYKQLGYPDTQEGYELADYGRKPDDIADMKRAFLEEAHKNYLSKGQAQNMWKSHLASIETEKAKEAQAKAAFEASYPERMDGYLRESFPDDTKRRQRIEAEKNLYSEFVAASGVGEKLAASGLTSDPEFMHALASWYERTNPQAAGRKSAGFNPGAGFEQFYTTM